MKAVVKSLMSRERLEKLLIANAIFLVDHKRRELREQRNVANRISFDTIHNDGSGNVSFIFDKITRNIYRGYMPSHGMPPMTEQVTLPATAFIPPDQRGLTIKAPPEMQISEIANNKAQRLEKKQSEPQQVARHTRRKYRRV